MLKRIVVAYDGSDQARAAYDAALMLARSVGASLLGVYVMEPTVAEMLAVNPGLAMDPLAPPAMAPPLLIDQTGRPPEKIEDDFEVFEQECKLEGVEFESKIGRGTLVDSLVREVRAGDMIAVGLKGRFARGGVGSSTRALATQSPCPVLVVNKKLGPVNRVLAAFDATEAAEAALRFAVDLGKQTSWPVTVLAMARGGVSLDQSVEWVEKVEPGAQVIPVGTDMGPGGDAWEAELIEKAAGGNRFSLLVMGAYADSALKDLLLGSRTGHVLSKLGGAVVLVHG